MCEAFCGSIPIDRTDPSHLTGLLDISIRKIAYTFPCTCIGFRSLSTSYCTVVLSYDVLSVVSIDHNFVSDTAVYYAAMQCDLMRDPRNVESPMFSRRFHQKDPIHIFMYMYRFRAP